MAASDLARPPLPTPVVAPAGAEPMTDDLLTPSEALALVNASSGRAPTGARNRALVAIMYRSGLRPGEALALMPHHVELEAGTVQVPPRKGGRPRLTGVDRGTRDLIAAWMARRAERGVGSDRPLFCTLAGEPLKAAYVRELLPRLARRAHISKRVHPLALRYANAAELAEEGFPSGLIDRHLGVAPIGGARRYRRHVTEDDVASLIAERLWSI